MPIILSETYETWTYDDIEAGDTDERGFNWENAPHTFRELVELIQREYIHGESNCSHGTPDWITVIEEDYRTGDQEVKSLHVARDDRSRRYWEKALRYTGFIK